MKLGNQQAADINLGYLCGMIDGEGSMILGKSNKRKNGVYALLPYLTIEMSDLHVVEKLQSILNELDVGSYIYHTKRNTHNLWCGGFKRLGSLLPFIIPHLLEKKERAEELRLYINRRSLLKKNTPYSVEDIQSYEKMKELNIKPKYRVASTTIPQGSRNQEIPKCGTALLWPVI